MSLAHFPWSLWDYSSYVFYDSNEHDLFVSLEDLEVVFRVYSVVMCRFFGFQTTAHDQTTPLDMVGHARRRFSSTCSAWKMRGLSRRLWMSTLDSPRQSARNSRSSRWFASDVKWDENQSCLAQQLDVFCWTVCWFLMVTVYGKTIEHVNFEKGSKPAILLIPRLAWVFVELKKSRIYFKSHFINLHYLGLYENGAPPRPDGGHIWSSFSQ